MSAYTNEELIIALARAFGITTGEIPTTLGPGLANVTTSSVRQPVQTVNTILKGADPNRVGLTIFNHAATNLFVKLGATVNIGGGTESFTRRIAPNEYWEIPFGYTGRVDGLWDVADAAGEALLVEQFTGFSPLSITTGNLLWWFRANYGVTNPGGAIPAWTDHSGQNRNLTQAVGADQPTHGSAIINGQDAIQFGPAASDNWMAFPAAFAAPTRGTTYAAIRMHVSNQYQLFMHVSPQGPGHYLGGDNIDFARNRPALYAPTGDVAVWSADLADNTRYIVKWAWNLAGGAGDFFTQVNADAEVSGAAANFAPGNFVSLGVDPAVTATQDNIADVVEAFCIDTDLLTAADEINIRNYLNAKIAAY